DSVALAYAQGAQEIRNLVAQRAQFPVGHGHSGVVFSDPVERDAMKASVPIDDRMPEIDVRPILPLEVAQHRAPVEVAHGIRIAGLTHVQESPCAAVPALPRIL